MVKQMPVNLTENYLSELLIRNGLTLKSRGKVRDIYNLRDREHSMLIVTSDRASIFDFVLGSMIPTKGEILTAMTVFWHKEIKNSSNINTHLLAYGSDIDRWLPKSLRGNVSLQRRAMVVKVCNIVPIEAVIRGFITGSAYNDYAKTGIVCGQKLPLDLKNGNKLDKSLFTPSSKSDDGHDENLEESAVNNKYGKWLGEKSLLVYYLAYQFALQKGIYIADTKFEWSIDRILCDEFLTPDSSRFWMADDWAKAQTQDTIPVGFDKQGLREWGKSVQTPWGVGLNELDPKNPEHVLFVYSLEVPNDIKKDLISRYKEIFAKLCGNDLLYYQENDMHIH